MHGGEARDWKRESGSRVGGDVGASSRTEASERVDQTMQEAATDGAESDAAGGSAPMEGEEVLLRCNRGPRLTPTRNLASEVFGC